jgi:SAM-dependent methyltransferase
MFCSDLKCFFGHNLIRWSVLVLQIMIHSRSIWHTAPPEPLMARYSPDDLVVFTRDEQKRWLLPLGVTKLDDAKVWTDWYCIRKAVAWQLLYRIEPELYGRLIAGENLHPEILNWFPSMVGCAVEVGAGLGRLTVSLAQRASKVFAVEPAAPLRDCLHKRLCVEGLKNVHVMDGAFDEIPLENDLADLVVACSSFTVDCGESGLREMERICRPGGLVAIIWPDDPYWLCDRGYTHTSFGGDMFVSFASLEEAVEISRIFYPAAVNAIEVGRESKISFDVLGIPAPRDFCWKRL